MEVTVAQTQTEKTGLKTGPMPETPVKPNGTGTEVAVRGPSVIADMAQRFGMDKRAFEATLRGTVFPGNGTNEEFAAFLLVARDHNLNPVTREIYAFPKKGGGIQPIVSIDGWLTIINRRAEMDGISFKDHVEGSNLVAITCTIHRKDRKNPIEITEYLAECKRNTEPWNGMPSRMLRHKATIQCARYAFGISGIQDPDEFERAQEMTAEPTPPRPTRDQFADASGLVTVGAQTATAETVTYVETEPVEQAANPPPPTKFSVTDLQHEVHEIDGVVDAHAFIKAQFIACERFTGNDLVGAWDGNAVAIGLIREVNPPLAEDIDAQFSASSQAISVRVRAEALAKAKADEAKAQQKTDPQKQTGVPDPVSPLTLPKNARERAWPTYSAWFLRQLMKTPADGVDAFLSAHPKEWEFIKEHRVADKDAADAIIDSKKNPPKD